MTYDEFMSWAAYINKRGTSNVGLRIESGIALLATLILSARGVECEMNQFMPHFDKVPITLAEAMKRWN